MTTEYIDRYSERIYHGECAWCRLEAVWSVCFDDCPHVTPCCDDHYAEYFLGVGWEWLFPPEDFDATCPDCNG